MSLYIPTDAKLSSIKIVLTQDNDCCDPETLGQSLEIETDNGGDVGEDFLVIKTERWAIDGDKKGLDEFNRLLSGLMEELPKADKANGGLK